MKTIPHYKIITALTLANIFFLVVWIAIQLLDDVYKYALIGAIFELIWLPTIAMLFISSLVSLFFWIKQKFQIRSAYFRLFISSLLLIYLLLR